MKDTSLAPHVPLIRKSMETIIFQVKAMLSDNNCPPDAFFLGALKHRDIRGEEVSSQVRTLPIG
ncbi:Fanconi anaemia protein FANCD2 [Endogone sp. FLAS-F59071]|nr:Fanconi anaemia protein FANCD2 [Endogone sp. FLAS-F59071]|eukprot:RUS21064.1 Fanconi anaemia protein FANCD2 [Endogone sp. FLAS-F59071]